jgi:hypothetical protein
MWRCGDGHFFEVSPLASDAFLTTLHPLLVNVLQTVDHFEISCLEAPFSWLNKRRNRMGRDLNWILCLASKKCIGGTPLKHPPYNPDFAPCDFWAFPTMKRELRGKKFRRDQRSAARFREVGGACKNRTSTKFRLGVIRLVHELFKWPSYSNHKSYSVSQVCVLKLKFSLCLTKHNVTKMCWESGGIAPCILNFVCIREKNTR